jgi:heme a synthase
VRVTNSGLGCPNWPACDRSALPPLAAHSVIEYGNRVLAFGVICVTVALLVNGWRTQRGHDRGRWWMVVAIAAGTLAQGPLGGITVLVGLHPIAVMSHFLLAIAIVAVATVLAVDVLGLAGDGAPVADWLRVGAPVLALWGLALIVSGAIVTESGTHPGSNDVPRLWNLLDAAYVHVRVAVSFVGALAAFLWALSRIPEPPRWAPRLAWATVGLTGVQIVIGEVQWRHQLPWYLVLAHVATATLLWTSLVALARVLVPRPAGATEKGPDPLTAPGSRTGTVGGV